MKNSIWIRTRALVILVGTVCFSGAAFAGIAVPLRIPALDEFGLVGLAVAVAAAGVAVLSKNRKK